MSFHDAMIILFIYNCCICITIYFYLLAINNKPIKTNNKKNIKEMWARDAHPEIMHYAAWPGWLVVWQQPQVSVALAGSTNENVCENQTTSFSPRSLPVWK